MDWFVGFAGQRVPCSLEQFRVQDIVEPLKNTVEGAFATADADEFDSLKVVVFVEQDDAGASWGVSFEGPPAAVNYAVDRMGKTSPLVKTRH